jgi:UDP-N-acetylglucosamine--N-acetylmuramyl-(pentapeptide) pyrophosphoryl-undecaprenol N-acetylglucosamine transferase
MERFFPAERILNTGNPIRKDIGKATEQQKEEGYRYYNLSPHKKTIFVVGGSLGCRTLNECMKKAIEGKKLFAPESDVQVIWQHGKIYKEEIDAFMKGKEQENIFFSDFIQRMDLAYAVADVVVSRAGAGTISELCVAEKCTVFVPSPVVAEDHQTHNAMALVNKNAAMIIKDAAAKEELIPCLENLLAQPQKIKELEENIAKLAKKDAAATIAQECLKLAKK